MKLTKAQRLFMKAGEEQGIMRRYSYSPEIVAYHKKERKRLIREALEAWQSEKAADYNDGYMEGYRAGIYDN